MSFQNIFIDVGEEEIITLPITDPLKQKTRNQNIEGFQKFDFTIQQNNQIIPEPTLFTPFPSDKLHGASYISTMRTHLEQLFSSIGSEEKLFTVVNRNTAHHMSYFLADFAFRHSKTPAHKKVVINIDQHLDYGAVKDPSKFLSWGGNVVSNTSEGLCYYHFQNYTDVTYVVVGLFSHNKPNITISSKTVQKKGTFIIVGKENVFSTNMNLEEFKKSSDKIYPDIIKFFLNEIFGEKIKGGTVTTNYSNTDYYITFDTDAMCGSNTCYHSGILTKKTISNFINQILLKITEYKDFLVGFDVTGLPIVENRDNIFDFPNYDDSYKQTKEIINEINCLVQKHFPD